MITVMKIFIVNLEGSVERRQSISLQCEKLGLPFEIFNAVDGRKFSQEELAAVTQKDCYAVKPGEVGCALSHIYIYRKMIDEGIKTALILEDDALLSDIVKTLVEVDPLANYNDEPKVLLLSKTNRIIDKKILDINHQYAIYPVYHATTTHAYMINLEAARNLEKLLFPVWMVADKWQLFEDYSAIKTLAVYPEPVTLAEHAQQSVILEDGIDENHIKKKKEIWLKIMANRPFKVKVRNRLRRMFTPLFYKIINVKKLRAQEQ